MNAVICGAAGLVGSGTKGCKIDPENIAALLAFPAGTVITEELTRESIRQMQKEGNLVVLPNIYDMVWAPEENQLVTSPSRGFQSLAREGLYSFTAQFDNGIHFQKTLTSMTGRNWEIVLVDVADNMWGTEIPNGGGFKGFRTSFFAANPYIFKTGTEGGHTELAVQFARSRELNAHAAVITAEQLDFLPTDLDGVNEVSLQIASLAAGDVQVRATLQDNDTFIDGLSESDFLVKADGATVAVTTATADASTKSYTLDAAVSADQRVEITLYDSSNNSPVVETGTAPDEFLVSSSSVTGVVTA